MELLIGLLIATVIVLGWWAGALFLCVFLTLADVMVAAVLAASGVEGMPVFICLVVGVLIWVPRWIALARYRAAMNPKPVYRLEMPPAPYSQPEGYTAANLVMDDLRRSMPFGRKRH
jgi:hypothetical protein